MSFFGKEKEEVSLIVDIGSGTITGALVLFTKSKPPQFLYSMKVPFVISEKPSVSRLVEGMSTLLELLLSTIMKQGFQNEYWIHKEKHLTNAMVSFSSPWFALKTKHINLSQNDTFIITQAFLDDIILKEEKLFEKDLLKSTAEKENTSFEIIEKSIIHTKINGYTLNNSIGSKTKLFDAFLCISVVSSTVIQKVQSLILKHTHISKERVLIHSFPLVSFSVIRDIFDKDSDFLLVDITGEVIDVTLVRDNVIIQTASIPSGRNFIIRQIAKKFEVSMEIAESTLDLYTRNKADDSTTLKMQEIHKDVEKEWMIYFEALLPELSVEKVVPSKIYVTADADVVLLNLNFFKSQTNSVTYIESETLSHFYTTDYKTRVDQFIALLAIFYDKTVKDR